MYVQAERAQELEIQSLKQQLDEDTKAVTDAQAALRAMSSVLSLEQLQQQLSAMEPENAEMEAR